MCEVFDLERLSVLRDNTSDVFTKDTEQIIPVDKSFRYMQVGRVVS